MQKLNSKQQNFLHLLPDNGSWVQVATSRYSLDAIDGQWNPLTYASSAFLRGLAKKNLIDLDSFYRGANVRLKQ